MFIKTKNSFYEVSGNGDKITMKKVANHNDKGKHPVAIGEEFAGRELHIIIGGRANLVMDSSHTLTTSEVVAVVNELP